MAEQTLVECLRCGELTNTDGRWCAVCGVDRLLGQPVPRTAEAEKAAARNAEWVRQSGLAEADLIEQDDASSRRTWPLLIHGVYLGGHGNDLLPEREYSLRFEEDRVSIAERSGTGR